jgi:hypothetical protein
MIPGFTPAEYFIFDGEQLVKGIWEPINPDKYNRLSYRDFHAFKGEVTEENLKTLYLMPDLLSGSDYSNSSEVHISNHRVFLKEFGKVKGVHDVYGGWGSFAVAIRADIAESNEQIKETLNGLENYPVIDEEDMSELRNSWEQETVKDMVHRVQNNIETDLEDLIENTDIDSEKVEHSIWEGINELNLDWSYESNSAYMDEDKVMPYVEDRVLLEHCKDLPLLVDREWSCNQTRTMFEQKLKGVPDGQDTASQ